MKALAGTNDFRDIEKAVAEGSKKALLALEIYTNSIKKYIGNFIAQMNGIDALVFTAGIGENSPLVRKMICKNLDYLGIAIDDDKNNNPIDNQYDISSEFANVKLLVIPTNEELEIARQSYQLMV
jgi:acetate kinase